MDNIHVILINYFHLRVLFCEATAQIGLAPSLLRTVDHKQLDTHQVGYL